ncbi:MAG: TIGR01777 family oxidoreductase [Lutibacter sp.]|uniref:TIGR01777 family oxidoreductase n=1 Tax=Lutibacter sp. TaxID=1925666 RepID=UPI00299ED4FB|nr:TIGR01777 family oxidoreductase [Lutibacter sp.]MDX1829868.1 TIGR01777 family oxidoreductase [Lutibacter sp.]
MVNILITGGTGLIGKHLANLLNKKGYKVLVLSRTKKEEPTSFYWNINNNYIDEQAIIETDYIIHLAGSGIADKKWTKARKKVLINSRVDSTDLLFKKVKEINPNLKGFISASGIGYYGAATTEKIYEENDTSGDDFVSEICKLWEKASLQFNSLNIRTVIFRTGVVLSNEGGAFPKIFKPIKFGFGAALGSGNQYIPWIHIDDLCNMYLEAIENNELKGVYNAVAPDYCNNKQLTKKIASSLGKKIWLPNIPSFIFKLIFGEMSIILLKGSRVSSKKIMNTGFKFKFQNLEAAFKNLIN